MKEVNRLAEGTVKWFSDQKGFGFITQDNGPDVFVHHESINGSGFKTLSENDRVRFDTVQGPKGLKAVNVEKL
ncbi:MAG: cold-shock protein [Candidatus Abyssobacteria bacterium SURF_5]|uniref:Cold-shock protein n=1 Tax=Abyssobacteria bacterium (strain SURF_5) TaxID=2093360 RepID=A0A3A4P3H7_ABYX5|nr:MAG: cold-shock protein [Candidatus Abyssubacteria bacterium SURF_5]